MTRVTTLLIQQPRDMQCGAVCLRAFAFWSTQLTHSAYEKREADGDRDERTGVNAETRVRDIEGWRFNGDDLT